MVLSSRERTGASVCTITLGFRLWELTEVVVESLVESTLVGLLSINYVLSCAGAGGVKWVIKELDAWSLIK